VVANELLLQQNRGALFALVYCVITMVFTDDE